MREWTRHPGFGALESAEFPFVQRTDREGFLARFMSYSSIAALPPDRRGEAENALVELLDSDPAMAGGPEIKIPYRCELFWSKRSGTPGRSPTARRSPRTARGSVAQIHHTDG